MKKKTKNFRFSIIPDYIKPLKELSSTDKLLYGEIYSLSESKGFCYANNQYFQKTYSISKSTVTKSISHLQSLKYINCDLVNGNHRKIYILKPPMVKNNHSNSKKVSEPSSNSTIAIVENDHNNRNIIEENRLDRIAKGKPDGFDLPFKNPEEVRRYLIHVLDQLYHQYNKYDFEDIISSIENELEKDCKQEILHLGLKEWFRSVLDKNELDFTYNKISEEDFLSISDMFEDMFFEVLRE